MRTVDAAPLPRSWSRPAKPAAPPRTGTFHAMRLWWRQRDRGLAGVVASAELGRETGVRC